MIAAMANHLEYEIYDLELTMVRDNLNPDPNFSLLPPNFSSKTAHRISILCVLILGEGTISILFVLILVKGFFIFFFNFFFIITIFKNFCFNYKIYFF